MKMTGIVLLICCLLPFASIQQGNVATSAEATLVSVSSVAHAEESDDILLNEALSLSQQVDAMARSEQWMKLMSGSDTLLEAARSFAGNRETAEAVYRLPVQTDSDVAQMLVQLTGEQVPQLDEVLMAQFMNRILNGLASQLNATLGVEALAAANCLQAASVFAGDVEDPVVYLLTYADASPILVVFQGERGAVQAVASPLHSSLDVTGMMDMLPLEKVQ